MAKHETREGVGLIGSVHTVEGAHALHHLASADPEVDGKMTGPAHEAKYGLDRAENSAAQGRGSAPDRESSTARGRGRRGG